jgi:hypothetical protein
MFGIDSMNIRTAARQLGIPRFLLQARALRRTGLRATLNKAWIRKFQLPKILAAPPIRADEGVLEVHMLLQKTRLLEGSWALYSLLYYSGQPLRVVIHDDGTLDAASTQTLARLLPGIRIIPRAEADAIVTSTLEKQGFRNCIEMRQRHVFGLKLLDPFILSRTPSYLTLDSDILTFSAPRELLDPAFGAADGTAPHLYSPDCWDSMALSPERLAASGMKVAYRLNAGLLKIQRAGFSLERLEAAISRLDLFGPDTALCFAEQTLYACELPCHGTVRLDPERYTICGDPNSGTIVTGHYCGDYYGKTRFYREGIPRLVKQLPLPQERAGHRPPKQDQKTVRGAA